MRISRLSARQLLKQSFEQMADVRDRGLTDHCRRAFEGVRGLECPGNAGRSLTGVLRALEVQKLAVKSARQILHFEREAGLGPIFRHARPTRSQSADFAAGRQVDPDCARSAQCAVSG